MGQEPDAIRQEIEDTRERMGGTVDALAYKADVKSRTKEKATEGAQRAVGVAQENPLGLAIGAVATGFLAGMLIPGTRVENDKFGHVADQVKEQVKNTAEDAVEHGKQVAQDAAHSAAETAKESGAHHAQDLQETAHDNAQAISPGAGA